MFCGPCGSKDVRGKGIATRDPIVVLISVFIHGQQMRDLKEKTSIENSCSYLKEHNRKLEERFQVGACFLNHFI